MELIEEYTLEEFLTFHFSFKPALRGLSPLEVARLIQLEHAFKKPIKYYSSGMKQRVRLGQAIFADSQLVLLDEPCSNLDKTGIELYQSLVENYCADRMVVVASNDPAEYYFCKEVFSMSDYK
jgi:ABC-type multidrug transport system ATPase subunit